MNLGSTSSTGELLPVSTKTLLGLPSPVLKSVLNYFTGRELRVVSQVCRRLNRLSSEFRKIDAQELRKKNVTAIEYVARKRYFDHVTQRRFHDPVVISPCGCHVNKEAIAEINVKPKRAFQKIEHLGEIATVPCKLEKTPP